MNFLRRLSFKPRPFPPTVGMISRQEQAWFRKYAAELYTGRGAIVDLGCFVGSTTICLAQGLQRNRAGKTAKIQAYDLFLWEEGFAAWWKTQDLPPPDVVDNCFLPEYLRRTAPWKDRVIVHKEDLGVARWDHGPIEFLLVDAMKSAELAEIIAQTFFPSLMPGTSYLVHQDFAHCFTYWIHLLQYRLRNSFVLAADIPGSASVVFRCEAAVSLKDLALPLGFASPAEIEAVFDYSLGLVADDKKPSIVAAKALACLETGEIERAREIVETNRWGSVSLNGELEYVTELIRQKISNQ